MPTASMPSTSPLPESPRSAARTELVVPMMGTTAHAVLTGGRAPSIEQVIAQLDSYESSWSRFRPGAELSRLGAGNGAPTVVSHPTAMLIERAVWAWQRTGGLFDPTVLQALRAVGYDRTFSEIVRDLVPSDRAVSDAVDRLSTAGHTATAASPGCAGIEVNSTVDLVRLPEGVAIDPGGIGKGLAADLAATAAVDAGADGAMVSIGGDLRVAGTPPDGGWEIELDHHIAPVAHINLHGGALATSSTLRRRWQTAMGTAHHVIDPRSGAPTVGPLAACSVVAGEAWWAEALSTALLVGWVGNETDAGLLELLADAGALLTFTTGAQVAVGSFADSFSYGGLR